MDGEVKAFARSPAEDDQLDALQGLPVQDAPPIDDDFSAHPAEVRGGQPPPLAPSVVHDTDVGLSEGAIRAAAPGLLGAR